MSELIERRVVKIEEDARVVQASVSKLLEIARETQRSVRRLVEQGTTYGARLGAVEIAVVGLREGQRTLDDQLDQINQRLDRFETVTGERFEEVGAAVAKILRRLPEQEA